MIALVALRAFIYQGKSYREGQAFDIEPVHAAILNRQRHARLLEPGQPKPKRQYRRRDMVAEA